MDYYKDEYIHVRNVLGDSSGGQKFMLVFINVLSGHGAAINVFIQAAMPYFSFANIKYDVVAVTSPTSGLPMNPELLQAAVGCESLYVLSGRISDFIQSMDLPEMEKYDAFVVVGGDGTLGELATGCMLYAQRAKEDATKYPSIYPDSELNQFNKPIGIIPAGSTDAVACTLFGSRDPHIAAICIALGATCYMDIQAVFADGHFAKISLAAVACGFLSETVIRVKKYAYLGEAKGAVSAAAAILEYKPCNVAIEYRPRDSSVVPCGKICTFPCSICEEWNKVNAKLPRNSSLSSKCEWRWAPIEPGAIAVLNAYASPVRLPFALKYGMAPLCHMCDGTSHIFVVPHHIGRIRMLLSMLAQIFNCIGTVYYQKGTFAKITAIRSCCEYRITTKHPNNLDNEERGILSSISWNIDGEVIAANSVHSVVHSKLLKFFGTGGPLPAPGIASKLFYARFAKMIAPGFILNPSPIKGVSKLSRLMLSVEDNWRGSKVDVILARYLPTKWHITSSSAGRLLVLCAGLAVLLFLLFLFYAFQSTAQSEMNNFSVVDSSTRQQNFHHNHPNERSSVLLTNAN